jgi:hypothetical protein
MVFTIFISVFYAVGLAILGGALWSARRSSLVAGWPATPGKVAACSLESKSDSEGGTTYEVKVKYDYSVQGKPFTGTRLAFGYAASSGQAAHQQICDKLQHSTSVDVRYDPNDPSVSTLSFGIHRSIRFMFAFAITWLAFVVGFTAIWWIASRSDDVLLQNLVVR